MIRLLATALALCAALFALPAAAQNAPLTPEAQVAQMGAGVNVLGYDSFWYAGETGNYKAEHFRKIKEAGFGFVRVNLFIFRHLREDGSIDPQWLEKLDWVIEQALANGLHVIIDEHDFDACSKDVVSCKPKLTSVWQQLATRYSHLPDTVMFELLNEPHTQFDAQTWNGFFAELLAIVRETNPTRNIVVGPVQWNSRHELKSLKLPEEDRHLIVTFHYYDPFLFTHQGASWTTPEIQAMSGIRFTAEDVAQMDTDFAGVAEWAKANNRPILLGEYGAYDRVALPEDRVLWTRTVSDTARKYGFAYAYWQFSSDFILFDFKTQDWVHPILNAIFPPDE